MDVREECRNVRNASDCNKLESSTCRPTVLITKLLRLDTINIYLVRI